MDIRLALMCGIDIPVPECQLVLHQPSIKEIAFLGEQDFYAGVSTLCLNKSLFEQGDSVLESVSNFEIFMKLMSEPEAADKKVAVQQALMLFLPNTKVSFTPRSLLLSSNGNISMVDESTFEYLQEAVRTICCLKSGPGSQQSFNPANKLAKEIADKLMRGRQRVAAQKGEENSSLISRYVSALTIAVPSMSLQNLISLTLFQLYDLVERYGLYMAWDLDIRSRLAGGKPEEKPDDWMKNIH